MKWNSTALLEDLENITKANIEAATDFLSLSNYQLNFKAAPNSWSILECLEHLNRYSSFYLPELSTYLCKKNTVAKPIFQSGLWGNYLVRMVIPKEGGKKMKTFSAMNPCGSTLDRQVIIQFIETQNRMEQLLSAAKQADLNTTCTPVTFTKLIRLKLGDALRFMAYHNQRHIIQAQK